MSLLVQQNFTPDVMSPPSEVSKRKKKQNNKKSPLLLLQVAWFVVSAARWPITRAIAAWRQAASSSLITSWSAATTAVPRGTASSPLPLTWDGAFCAPEVSFHKCTQLNPPLPPAVSTVIIQHCSPTAGQVMILLCCLFILFICNSRCTNRSPSITVIYSSLKKKKKAHFNSHSHSSFLLVKTEVSDTEFWYLNVYIICYMFRILHEYPELWNVCFPSQNYCMYNRLSHCAPLRWITSVDEGQKRDILLFIYLFF